MDTVLTRKITAEEFSLMRLEGPYELVDGELKSMSPAGWHHGYFVIVLGGALLEFVRERDLGKVIGGEAGLITKRNPDGVRGIDVGFISRERLAQVESESYLDVAPELVIEVVSPGNTWQEMREKIEEYFGVGVERVWIVEPERRRALVYRDAGHFDEVGRGGVLRGEGVLDGFALPLDDLFAE